MPVRPELSMRRLLAALALLAALPVTVVLVAARSEPPGSPPGPASYNPLPLVLDPVHRAWQSRDMQRSRRNTSHAPQHAGPVLLPASFPEPLPTVLLTPRAEPYDLEELRRGFPSVLEAVDGGLLLRANIDVPRGARLVVDGARTPDVRLLSSAAGFASVIAWGGDIEVRGRTRVPARISSWDPAVGAPDGQLADGRAYLLVVGGRMDIHQGDLGHLGFGSGTTSGVAWRGHPLLVGGPLERAGGTVTRSVLHHNWFGAYTYEAQGMHFAGNTFAHNDAYGFDPHDLSNDFLVERNVAHSNGRHGFIFSRGCDRNVLRDNLAYGNRGHGFMIDDGRSADAPDAGARPLPSNHNQLLGNRAHDNHGSGIEVEGGWGTVIRGNVLVRNHVGIRVKDEASAVIAGNRLADNRLAGVDVLGDAGEVDVRGNDVTGGWAGIALGERGAARLTSNDVADAAAALVVDGRAEREEGVVTEVGRVLRWNPVLVLWSVILGVPAVFAVHRVTRWLASGHSRGATGTG